MIIFSKFNGVVKKVTETQFGKRYTVLAEGFDPKFPDTPLNVLIYNVKSNIDCEVDNHVVVGLYDSYSDGKLYSGSKTILQVLNPSHK